MKTCLLIVHLLCCVICASARPPNVLIVFTDDQGTLDAGCYGAEHLYTPHIDSLAAQGVRFTQAYAHTFCCPSRASLLTGRHPQRGGVNHWTQNDIKDPTGGVNMHLSEITLAELLKDAGYRTGLFGKWHLGADKDHGPTRQGFDEFFGIRGGFIDNYNHAFLQGDGYHDLYDGTDEQFADGEYFPELMTQRAEAFIDKYHEEPFFVYFSLNTPHYPEQPRQQDLARYASLEEPRRTYAAFVTTTDYYIGRMLKRLEQWDLRKQTIVIFMSDNGHQSYDALRKLFEIKTDNHPSGLPKGYRFAGGDAPNPGGGYTGKWIGHKSTFLEGGLRVPAIISYPGVLPEGVVRDQIISVMDWVPTVLDLCALDPPDYTLDGRSLVSMIQSNDVPSPHPVLYFQWQNKWAVREGPWKLVRIKGNRASYREHFYLFNLDDQNPEQINYFDQHPERVAYFKALYAAWEKEVFAGQSDRPWIKPEVPPVR